MCFKTCFGGSKIILFLRSCLWTIVQIFKAQLKYGEMQKYFFLFEFMPCNASIVWDFNYQLWRSPILKDSLVILHDAEKVHSKKCKEIDNKKNKESEEKARRKK